jgi:N-acetylmuramoyl-L-alanine amidase
MRRHALRQLQVVFGMIGLLALAGIVVIVGRGMTFSAPSSLELPEYIEDDAMPAVPPVALISGHAGNDSGAVCTDNAGNVVAMEAEINERVTQAVARFLAAADIPTLILDEYDPQLVGLEASVLLSLHADSCIEVSGYKAAHRLNSPLEERENQLLACIDHHYAAVTGLAPHPDTITPNMTEYHAYRQIAPSTPAAVLEMGFLGGDRALLTQQPDLVAKGIVDSLLCFLAPAAHLPQGAE